MAGDSYLRLPKIFPASQGHGLLRKSAQLIEKCWRPRRDLNPCYRRESGMTKRNSNKLQERERTGWRSRNSKKHLIVSPMCPRTFDTLEHFPAYLITQDQRKLPSSYVNESRGSGQSSRALNQDRYGYHAGQSPSLVSPPTEADPASRTNASENLSPL